MNGYEVAWKILTLPCAEAARLSSEALDRALPASDRIAVRLHTISCASCRRYRHQLLSIRRASSLLAERIDPPAVPLPDDVRDRIKRSLKDG